MDSVYTIVRRVASYYVVPSRILRLPGCSGRQYRIAEVNENSAGLRTSPRCLCAPPPSIDVTLEVFSFNCCLSIFSEEYVDFP